MVNAVIYLTDKHPTEADQDLMLDILAENAKKGERLGLAYDLGPYPRRGSPSTARRGVRLKIIAGPAVRQ